MEKNTGAFKHKRIYFSQVSNTALRDTNMSLKAKGLYSLIQSYITIEDFTLYKTTLQKMCKEGRDGFNSAWNELKKCGYLVQYKYKDKSGAFYYEYELLDAPLPEKSPDTEIPSMEKTTYGKTTPGESNSGISTPGKPSTYNNIDTINTNTTNTDEKNITSSSSKDIEGNNIVQEFESNICKLKKTTLPKFLNIILNFNKEMVLAVIEECAITKVESYKGFESAFNSYTERGCITAEDVKKAATEYRENKKTYKNKNHKTEKSSLKFNNFEARSMYDDPVQMKSLEEGLLGWNNDKERNQ